MRIDNILCIEYLSSGGLAPKEPLPGNLLAEGFSMLASVCADFTTLFARKGQKAVQTVLDHRLKPYDFALDAYISKYVKKEPLDEVLGKTLEKEPPDAALIIAPDGPSLLNLVDLVSDSGVVLLGPSIEMIEKVSPKSQLYQRCQDLDVLSPPDYVLVPEAEEFEVFQREIASSLEKWQSPLVVKPDMSCGGEGLSLILDDSEKNLKLAFEKARAVDDTIIVQKMKRGTSISLSIVGSDKEPSLLSVNKQILSLSSPDAISEYKGGSSPVTCDNLSSIMNDVKILIEDTGYRGYFGIDLVANTNGFHIVDFNPRITTSYVGLREVTVMNPAQIMLDVVFGFSPPSPQYDGSVRFGKVSCPHVNLEGALDIFEISGCICPPFHFTEDPTAFFTALGTDEEDAEEKFIRHSEQTSEITEG